jgi:hypothetical protein
MGTIDKILPTAGAGLEPEEIVTQGSKKSIRWAWVWTAALVSLALTCLVARSAFRSGYLLQVDAAFGPKAPPYIGGFYAPIWAVEKLSVVLFGGAVTGRIYLFGVLFFAAFLPMALVRRAPWWAQLFAGVFGILNPFTYDRLVEGQWTVIASCDGLFLWLILWNLIDKKPTVLRGIGLAAATFIVVSFSAHFAGILVVLAAACVIGYRVWRSRARLRTLGLALGLSLLALAPGAVLFFTDSGGATASQLTRVTSADLHFFRPTGASPFGLLDLFGLYGYWGERLGRFPVATAGSSWWVLSTAALVALGLVGAFGDRRRTWLLVSGFFGILVSIFLASSWGGTAFAWLAAHASLVRGYREPEKWSALWLVALVPLGAVAVGRIGTWRSIPRSLSAVGVSLALVAVLLPAGITELRGAGSTLVPVRYPSDWYAASRYLSSGGRSRSTVMVLPWHLYEGLSFTHNRLVENPGPVFFPGRILSSESDQIEGDAPLKGSPGWAEYVSPGSCNLAGVVRAHHVDFVVVEPAPGGVNDTSSLIACGMEPILRSSQITVLTWPQTGYLPSAAGSG